MSEARVTVTGHPAWENTAIDVAACHRLEIVVTLFEHERAGIRPETWPPAVAERVARELAAWLDAHPGARPQLISYGVMARDTARACVAILHYRHEPPAKGETDGESKTT